MLKCPAGEFLTLAAALWVHILSYFYWLLAQAPALCGRFPRTQGISPMVQVRRFISRGRKPRLISKIGAIPIRLRYSTTPVISIFCSSAITISCVYGLLIKPSSSERMIPQGCRIPYTLLPSRGQEPVLAQHRTENRNLTLAALTNHISIAFDSALWTLDHGEFTFPLCSLKETPHTLLLQR